MAKKCKHEYYPIAFFQSSHEDMDGCYLVLTCAYYDSIITEHSDPINEEED